MTSASGTARNLLRNRTRELTDLERSVIEASVLEVRQLGAGEIAVRELQPVHTSTLLVDGFMSRRVDARDGRRHLVAVHVPGDFVDLHAYPLGHLDHDVGALTDVTVALVPHVALGRIQADHPHLAKQLWFLTLLDAAMHRQWIFRASSLSAIERVAHFLCEMMGRLLAIDACQGGRFLLPMTQVEIGEVCGLTNVHVNRVLRQLRETGLCTVRSSNVEVHDAPGLIALGQFDPAYLYLNEATLAKLAGTAE